MQRKVTVRCYLTSVKMDIIKKSMNSKCYTGSREKGTFLNSRNVNWCNRQGKQYRSSSKN